MNSEEWSLADDPGQKPSTPGTQVGPYRIELQLGEGGMGTVYRAHDTKLNRSVAIKVLSDELADAAARRRESGRFEVYVRSFPSGEGKWRVSANGGGSPRWRRDGKELFYTEGNKLMAEVVTTQPGFSPGTPAPLFEENTLQSVTPQYDVTADGKRFIVRERPVSEKPLAIHVVNNWFEEFRRKPQE